MKADIIPINQCFERLIIKSIINHDGYRKVICDCSCGTKDVLIRWDALKAGKTRSCGCLQKQRASETGRLNPGDSSYNEYFRRYKCGASNRRIVFDLTKDNFKKIIHKDCHYCGAKPRPYNWYYKTDKSRVDCSKATSEEWAAQQWIYVNGIDRIDSTSDYNIDNCIPCCKQCNYAKNDMSYSEFIEYLNNLAKFTLLKNNY